MPCASRSLRTSWVTAPSANVTRSVLALHCSFLCDTTFPGSFRERILSRGSGASVISATSGIAPISSTERSTACPKLERTFTRPLSSAAAVDTSCRSWMRLTTALRRSSVRPSTSLTMMRSSFRSTSCRIFSFQSAPDGSASVRAGSGSSCSRASVAVTLGWTRIFTMSLILASARTSSAACARLSAVTLYIGVVPRPTASGNVRSPASRRTRATALRAKPSGLPGRKMTVKRIGFSSCPSVDALSRQRPPRAANTSAPTFSRTTEGTASACRANSAAEA